ncbi:Uncharacterised protein [uncultured archaeon]|nr:Uncharacterised protein [uncultured archaeon]
MGKREEAFKNSAINEGIGQFVQAHSRYISNPGSLYHNIDRRKVDALFTKAMTPFGATPIYGLSQADRDAIFEDLVSEISAGNTFNASYAKRVLPGGKKGKLEKVLAFVRGEKSDAAANKYLDEKAKIVYGMLPVLAQEGAPKEASNVIEAAGRFTREAYRSALADEAVSYGLVKERDYLAAKRDIHGKAKKSYTEFETGIQKFVTGEKVAASILGVAGVGILFLSGRQLTGNAVGNIGIYPGLGFFVGLGLAFASFLLFARISRDKKKAIYMRR